MFEAYKTPDEAGVSLDSVIFPDVHDAKEKLV